MFGLFKAVVLVAVLVGGGAFLLGWWGNERIDADRVRDAVGTTGVNAERARQVGAAVEEKTAAAVQQARRALTDGSYTAKIKAKMALDDTVKAFDINVDTTGTTVTLTGTVHTKAQHERVLQLARETEGITKVVDRVTVR
jgi:hyperosmotically inducible periplasmic protein